MCINMHTQHKIISLCNCQRRVFCLKHQQMYNLQPNLGNSVHVCGYSNNVSIIPLLEAPDKQCVMYKFPLMEHFRAIFTRAQNHIFGMCISGQKLYGLNQQFSLPVSIFLSFALKNCFVFLYCDEKWFYDQKSPENMTKEYQKYVFPYQFTRGNDLDWKSIE